MNIRNIKSTVTVDDIGAQMHRLIAKMYPICRSLTGNGVRQTLATLREYIPLVIHEVPSGTQVFDWTVPKEWNIRDAYVKNLEGKRVIDFQKSNLHVVGYSIPVRKTVSLRELRDHLFTFPDYPNQIPFRTSYYNESWGFCLRHDDLLKLQDEEYEVCIDATLENGNLTYGEYYIKGSMPDEILISCHLCHPSLCNDNLSGVSLVTLLAKYLASTPLRYSYRFLFAPATIGAITWLSLNEARIDNIKHGLVAACVGDPGKSTYKKSRIGTSEIDVAVAHMLKHSGQDYRIIDFSPYGYDERQFCSPAFNLPIGCLMRTQNGEFPEYHTSADDLAFVRSEALGDSFWKYLSVLEILENNGTYINQNPKCEPQLGRRGIYKEIGGQTNIDVNELAMLWTLSYSDGHHSLLDIAERSGLEFESINSAANLLLKHSLLKRAPQIS